MEHPGGNFHVNFGIATKKPDPLARAGLLLCCLKLNQPRVRERIMKLSKVYSATCHHRYSSDR
jgi:hypothetical protein